ncbi:MAG: hypothetical protein AAGE59_20770 [Cyanobacteria bacterium P01_F01_bin.86]
MAELAQSVSFEQATLEELSSAIAELEQYRERLVSDTLAAAKKAKVLKSQAQAGLEPALANIDAMLGQLRQRQTALAAEN